MSDKTRTNERTKERTMFKSSFRSGSERAFAKQWYFRNTESVSFEFSSTPAHCDWLEPRFISFPSLSSFLTINGQWQIYKVAPPFYTHVSDVSGVIVLPLSVCLCVRPSVSLSRLNGQTYKLEFWHGCQVEGYLGQVYRSRSRGQKMSNGVFHWLLRAIVYGDFQKKLSNTTRRNTRNTGLKTTVIQLAGSLEVDVFHNWHFLTLAVLIANSTGWKLIYAAQFLFSLIMWCLYQNYSVCLYNTSCIE